MADKTDGREDPGDPWDLEDSQAFIPQIGAHPVAEETLRNLLGAAQTRPPALSATRYERPRYAIVRV